MNRSIGLFLGAVLATSATSAAAVDRLSPTLATSVAELQVRGDAKVAALPPRALPPQGPWTPLDVAEIVVLNSPDLKAKRAAAGVAAAQAFAARLLPDPQIGLSEDFALPGSGGLNAYGLSPNLDLAGLITHQATARAARESAEQINLEVLWAEWSAAQQARALAVTIVNLESKALFLTQAADEARAQSAAAAAAWTTGDYAASAVSADIASAQDWRAQALNAAHDAASARLQLNALMGLAPQIHVDLAMETGPPPAEVPNLDAALADLGDRRPDLMALHHALASQNAQVVRAALSRFPLLNLGFSRQSDNGGIGSNGVTATLTIPLFNGGRGEVAVQKATLAQVRAEAQSRLDQALSDVATARHDLASAAMATDAAGLGRGQQVAISQSARLARENGDLDGSTALGLRQMDLKSRLAVLDADQAAELALVTLETQLFVPPTPRRRLGAQP